MAMFPPSIPHTFIRWLTNENDVVYDPFSGRGTTAFEASLLGRVAYASDLNPLASVLSGAKISTPRRWEVRRRLRGLRSTLKASRISGEPEYIRVLFAKDTLRQLLWLRETLDREDRVDRFILAMLLGVLHRNAGKQGVARGLTVAMPNTFSMAPGYVSRYIEEHELKPPDVDVIAFLEDRLDKYELGDDLAGRKRGFIWEQDAGRPVVGPVRKNKAKLIFTSPPYLQAILYGKFNWIRLWLLGEQPRAVDRSLFTSTSPKKYEAFMSNTIRNLSKCLRPDGYLCFVVGDVCKGDKQINLARRVAKHRAAADLALLATVRDQLPAQHKVSRIWGKKRGQATKVDRIVIMGGPRARLPRTLPEINWDAEEAYAYG